MATVPLVWVWVALAVTALAIGLLLTVRMRRIGAAKLVAELEERQRMEGRLALIEEAPPLVPPPSIHTKPIDRWTRRRLPAERDRS